MKSNTESINCLDTLSKSNTLNSYNHLSLPHTYTHWYHYS